MANLGDSLPKLDVLGYEEGEYRKTTDGRSLTDDAAIALIYELYNSLHKLHTSNIILGDLNPSNILYNFDTRKPCFIDMDSASVGKYGCVAFTPSYLDPLVEDAGKNSEGLYKFSPMSDYFAMAVIAHELFVGARPFFCRASPVMTEPERCRKRIALIGHLEDPDFLQRMGTTLREHNQNTIMMERLHLLKRKDRRLYQYLFDTLILDRRENLLYRLPKTDNRNPAYVFHAKGKVKTIIDFLQEVSPPVSPTQSFNNIKTVLFDGPVLESIVSAMQKHQHRIRQEVNTGDPDIFKRFVENMGIDYMQIVREGVTAHA